MARAGRGAQMEDGTELDRGFPVVGFQADDEGADAHNGPDDDAGSCGEHGEGG